MLRPRWRAGCAAVSRGHLSTAARGGWAQKAQASGVSREANDLEFCVRPPYFSDPVWATEPTASRCPLCPKDPLRGVQGEARRFDAHWLKSLHPKSSSKFQTPVSPQAICNVTESFPHHTLHVWHQGRARQRELLQR